MPFTPKNLDDRSFQNLFDEAKRRIVAYLPEWTDHNDSDPGITLVQLFAWLTETAIFRLNQVPDERMYVSFLNLVGIGPAPAVPAQTLIELEMSPGASPITLEPYELRLAAPGEEDEIPFEADARVPLVGASLAVVLVDDGISPERFDATAANLRGDAPFPPFGPARVRGRALYLGLDATPRVGRAALVRPGGSAELQIHVERDEEAAPLAPASTSYGEEVISVDGDVAWEGRTEGGGWAPLTLVADETRGLRRSGFLRIRLTDALQPGKEPGDPEDKERFWIRAVPADAEEANGRRIRHLGINAARVHQWRTYAREPLVPGSDGTPHQARLVRHPPILIDRHRPPVLEVNEPDESGDLVWREWACVDDLATRSAGGEVAREGHPLRVFRVRDDRTGVELGDGIAGMIPPRGPNNLRITYRSGGGAAGNVAAGQLSLAVTLPDLRGVAQQKDAAGGADEERVEDARRSAPGRIRAVERAVTAADLEVIAAAHAGVARATAKSRYHPLYPHAPATGAVTLVVVPPRAGDEPAPLPTQAFLDEVAAAIEPYRVLTTELFVVPPVYRTAVIDVEVEVLSDLDAPAVRAGVAERLRRHLDPIEGGRDGRGFPLGGAIAYGELLSLVLGAPRVAAVRALSILLDGRPGAPCADVELGSPLALVASGPHVVRVRAPERRR